MRLFLVAAIMFAPSSTVFSEDDPPLPLSAARLMDVSAHAEARLEQDYKQKLIDEQTKLYASLDKICKDQIKSGDVDGALAVKKAMKRISGLITSEKQTMQFSHYSEEDVAKMLMSTSYDFQFPSGRRILKFGERGTFIEGANEHESSWRVVGLQLEICDMTKAIFSRWNLDPSTGEWNSVKDKDVICQADLKLTPIVEDPHN